MKLVILQKLKVIEEERGKRKVEGKKSRRSGGRGKGGEEKDGRGAKRNEEAGV